MSYRDPHDPRKKAVAKTSQKKWRQTLKGKDTRERLRLKTVFGITSADKWDRFFGDQNGHCANPACNSAPHNHKISWQVHHIHGSAPLRWCVCCNRCNWASGKFKDSPALLRSMADLNENLTPDGYHTPSLVELVQEAQCF